MSRAPKRCSREGCDNRMPCAAHPPSKNRRPSSTARGYDAEHEAERIAWQIRMDRGDVVHCRRGEKCLRFPDTWIDPKKPWHLGHPDAECDAPRAPEHMRCNTSAPGRLR